MSHDDAVKNYWLGEADKHAKKAKTMREKYARTGEAKWLKHAITNEKAAAGIRYNYGK